MKITCSHSEQERVVVPVHISVSRSRSDYYDLMCRLKAHHRKHSHVTCRTPCTVIAATSNSRYQERAQGQKEEEGGRGGKGEGERGGRRRVPQLLVTTSASTTSRTWAKKRVR